jgi:hypothetical protein
LENCNILSSLKIRNGFEFFYSNVQQNDSGLCFPRKIVSKAAVFTADLDSIATVGKFKDIIDKLADVITYWNGNMEYYGNNHYS